MATLSITKNINIKSKKVSRNLVYALENAENKKCKEVVLERPYNEIKGEDLDKLFGANK